MQPDETLPFSLTAGVKLHWRMHDVSDSKLSETLIQTVYITPSVPLLNFRRFDFYVVAGDQYINRVWRGRSTWKYSKTVFSSTCSVIYLIIFALNTAQTSLWFNRSTATSKRNKLKTVVICKHLIIFNVKLSCWVLYIVFFFRLRCQSFQITLKWSGLRNCTLVKKIHLCFWLDCAFRLVIDENLTDCAFLSSVL